MMDRIDAHDMAQSRTTHSRLKKEKVFITFDGISDHGKDFVQRKLHTCLWLLFTFALFSHEYFAVSPCTGEKLEHCIHAENKCEFLMFTIKECTSERSSLIHIVVGRKNLRTQAIT